ncbi:MAG TPA: SOS response-associated peptidase [Syntrophales bacterium]|nr:SOS response-associated peptidase [Syntrophales bacterium]
MCGRFTLIINLSTVVKTFHVQEVASDYRQGNNISPTQQISAIIHDNKTKLVNFRWGLIPSWAKDPSIGNKMFNARAETIADKPSFRSAFIKRRCLIIADGFYEWQQQEKRKQPFHLSLKSGAPFGFAGLYETWMSPEQKPVSTCTIITTDPNELIKPIHDRMPVIVPKDKEVLWINMENQDQKELASILKPYPAEEMRMTEGFIPMP